ncbi:hypothetical protein PCANC_00303 [Puccinia coronata f. sp. avenae]|uniref:Uncharacterized protein n=1 Tax=Puccinia coronata f. sp. avenae TaxID=200324 RepID=A0A2N5W956_9BASI|nr:hypothetical protein PCANC_00303 [Puccinia coronata f. sp. avenae]
MTWKSSGLPTSINLGAIEVADLKSHGVGARSPNLLNEQATNEQAMPAWSRL